MHTDPISTDPISPELLWTLCGITGVVAASLILVRTRVATIQENLTPLRADR